MSSVPCVVPICRPLLLSLLLSAILFPQHTDRVAAKETKARSKHRPVICSSPATL